MQTKTVLITGSSRGGIGAAAARIAKAKGATVILHCHTENTELQDLAKELDCTYIVCDAADKQAVEAAVAQINTSLAERTAQPEEVAEAMIFLASDEARFITGQTLVVDGGYGIAGK